MRFGKVIVGVLAAGLAIATPALAQQKPQDQDTEAQDNRTQAVADAIVAKRDAQAQQESWSVPPLTPDNTWNLDLSTGGRVVIQLRPDKAPHAVERIKALTRQGFYDGLSFHRVIEGFMAQGGDPKGTGEGGSTLPDLGDEFNDMPHVRGDVSMAKTDAPNSSNSQFFIMLQPNLRLDGHYTAIGRVVSGMAYADAIHRGEPPEDPSRIVHATIGTEAPAPPHPSSEAAGTAAAAAAKASADQASDAKLAADEASSAAAKGDTATAVDRSKDAAVEAAGAASASQDAAEAASQAKPKKHHGK